MTEKSIAIDQQSGEILPPLHDRRPPQEADARMAAPTKLHNLRVGTHTGFTRIVLDSEGARPLSIGPASSREIAVRYAQLELLCDPISFSRSYPGSVAQVSHQKEATAGKIIITYRQPDTRVKTFFLSTVPPQKGFYRLVMDFYPSPKLKVNETAPPPPGVTFAKTGKEIAAISQPAPAAPSPLGTKGIIRQAGQPPKIVPAEIPPKPSMLSAQLEKTGSSEEKPGEAPGQRQEIIPLEKFSRPTRGGPARLGLTPRGYTSKYFQMTRPRLGLGLSYEFEEERRENPNSRTTVTSHEFRQKVALETDGWVYHPALWKYMLRFEPEWVQVIRDSDPGESGTDTPFQPFYSFESFFLEPKPYTLYGFANRREIKIRGAFATPSDTIIETYGGDLRLKYQIAPTLLRYTHTDTDQSGFIDTDGDRDDFQLTSRHVSANSTTNLNALYSDDTRTSAGSSTRLKTITGDLGNNWDIAGDRRKKLLSDLSYRWSETDSDETSNLRFSENLFLRHSEKLNTNYLLAFDTSDSDDFDRDTTTLRTRLQHLLYENLTTTVGAGVLRNDTTAGQSDILDSDLNLLYKRNIPGGGLTLQTNFDYRITDRTGFDEGLVQINNEPHALATGVVTLLDNQNVDLDSVVVTDIAGTISYIENVDYTLAEIDSFVSISRTLVGAIANDQTVLVDYRFVSDPNYKDSVFGQAYNIQFLFWNALTLAYSFLDVNQDIISGTPPENTVDDRTHAGEIRLNLGWTDTRLTFKDSNRSSDLSTTEWLAEQTFRYRPARRFVTDVTGFYGWTDFKDQGATQDRYGMSGRIYWLPARWCNFSLEGYWQKIDGDIQETEDINVTAALELSYRIWRGGIYYRYSHLSNEGQKQIRNNLRAEIVRILW